MKLVCYFIGACVILAIARAMAAALVLLIILAIVIGAISKPRETIGLLGFVLITNLLMSYPVACLCTLAVIAILKNIHDSP